MPRDPKTHAPDTSGEIALDVGGHELDVRVGLGLFASESQVSQLLSIARQVDVDAGQTLYAQDTPAVTLFQIASGQVELRAGTEPAWHVIESGAVGFVDFVLGRPHTRTAVTTAPCRLLELDASDYRDYLEDNFEIVHQLLARVSAELVGDAIATPEPGLILESVASPRSRSYAKVEVPVVERLTMMSRLDVFAGASMQALAYLAQSAREIRFEPGDVIAAAASTPTMLSILVEGSVELRLPDGNRVQRAGRDLVAHVEELATAPRKTTVVATAHAIVLQIEREELLDRFEEHFELALAALSYVVREQGRLNDILAGAGLPVAMG
ncbi:MAG: cyclic nucleotide-binding domain-containing protein [Kofleriaceae bacterium]